MKSHNRISKVVFIFIYTLLFNIEVQLDKSDTSFNLSIFTVQHQSIALRVIF